MLSREAFHSFLLLTWLTVLAPSTASAPVPQHCVGECRPLLKDYMTILDAVFPLDFSGDPYVILRFMPAGQSEFQIAIGSRTEGTYDVREYSLPKGAEPIGTQMMQLKAVHPNDTPVELARYIKIETKSIQLDANVLSRLMKSLSELKIPAEISKNIMVDASSYEFWFVARPACHVLHLAVSDAHYGHDAKAHPLVRWMNRVRRAAEAAGSEEK